MSARTSPRVAACSTTESAYPAFILHGFWDELGRRGVSLVELERLSGVTRPRRDDFSSTLFEQDIHRLFESAVALTGDDTLGLSIGRGLTCSSLHLVGHLILASSSLHEAFELVRNSGRYWHDPALEELGHDRMRFGFYSKHSASAGTRTRGQLTGVVLYDMASHFLNGASEAVVVQFDFPAPPDASAYLHAFPSGVEFDADGTFVSIPTWLLHQRRSGADPALAQQLLALAQQQYGGSSADEDSWAGRVRRALRANTTPRLVRPSLIASQLGLSPRALSRRLTREATSFSTLVETVVYERAKLLLSRPRATCAGVAEALGYAELSSFHRAFRRWSGGLTPNEYRQRQRVRVTESAR